MTSRWFLATTMLSAGLLAAPRSPIRNPGFESGGKSVGNWSVPTYWSGAVEPCTENPQGGKRCAKITTSTSRGRVWGRILHGGTLRPQFGRKIRYSAWVRGNGEILLGVIRYTQKTPGKPNYQYLWQEPVVQLGDKWREIVLEFRIMDPRIIRLCPVVEVRGEGAVAYVDEVAYELVVSKDVVAKIVPNHPLAALGRSTDVVFSAERKGQPLTGSVTLLVVPPEGEPSSIELPLDDRGQTTYCFAPETAADDPWRLVFLHGESGASATVYADAMSTDVYESMAKAAKALSAKPQHLLFIGDSLSDQKRGYNYVDKIGYWLSERTGGKGTVKNVGVGGDFISRVWQRLNKDPKSYRLNMYEDIFDPKPSRVFIFLGHNDSKANSRTNYTTHCVDPVTFEEEYRKTILKIQADTGAPVTVISATSSVYEITKAAADKRTAAGKAHNLFGRPDHLELFNAIAKRVAEETGCDYVDVYTPTRTHADKPRLFTGDGVHLSSPGNRYIALLLLRYLANVAP